MNAIWGVVRERVHTEYTQGCYTASKKVKKSASSPLLPFALNPVKTGFGLLKLTGGFLWDRRVFPPLHFEIAYKKITLISEGVFLKNQAEKSD